MTVVTAVTAVTVTVTFAKALERIALTEPIIRGSRLLHFNAGAISGRVRQKGN